MSNSNGHSNSEALIRHLLKGTCTATGREFFRALVRSAAMAMNVAGVWVTEYLADRKVLRSLAFWMNDHHVENYEYQLAGTPCEQVIERACLVHYPDRIIQLFPTDADLHTLKAVSYAGVPLLKPDGTVGGHLSALDTKPLGLAPGIESAFRIFAARAAAELNRLHAESAIRESEQRFSRLFESAMDAIFELDHDFRIERANESASSLFIRLPSDLTGRKLTTLLTPGSAQKLSAVVQDLDTLNEPSAWVPRGFDALRSDGSAFAAEATVSRFELSGRRHYSVILRPLESRAANSTSAPSISTPPISTPRTKADLRELEKETLVLALKQAQWKVAGPQGAARALGIPPSTLASRMKALHIERPDQRRSLASHTSVSRVLNQEQEAGLAGPPGHLQRDSP